MASRIDDAQFQLALGRILCELELNHRFLDNPPAVGAELGLDADQVAALESAGLPKLHTFAHNLASKRIGLLKKVCPATYELMQQRGRLGELAGDLIRRRPPIESREYPNRTIRDGLWLIEELLRRDAAGGLNDPVLADVARFERAVLAVTAMETTVESAKQFAAQAAERPTLSPAEMLIAYPRRGPHSRIEEFGIDIVSVVRTLGEGGTLNEARRVKCILLFSKQPGWRNVHYAVINRQTRQLLELCDGVTTSQQIIARLLHQNPLEVERNAFTENGLALLTRLVSANAVTLDL